MSGVMQLVDCIICGSAFYGEATTCPMCVVMASRQTQSAEEVKAIKTYKYRRDYLARQRSATAARKKKKLMDKAQNKDRELRQRYMTYIVDWFCRRLDVHQK